MSSDERGRKPPVVLADSITSIGPDDAGAIVVSGSHGGSSAAGFALAVPLRLVVFNDAGVGKDRAGVAALELLQAQGRPAATVSHESARIGEAADSLASGVISHVNAAAEALGLRVGERLRDALVRVEKDAY